jgi:hypothetical protein
MWAYIRSTWSRLWAVQSLNNRNHHRLAKTELHYSDCANSDFMTHSEVPNFNQNTEMKILGLRLNKITRDLVQQASISVHRNLTISVFLGPY